MERFDTLVVGGGAAGLSAALILGRSRRNVLVCDDGRPRNGVADRMHGFLTRDGTPPFELLAFARAELRAYPSVRLHEGHVVQADRQGDEFIVRTQAGETFASRTILLAIGVYDVLPALDGLADMWGKRVYVCPYCDGWEVRDRRIAVLGKGRRAVELAQELHQWTDELLVCVDGDDGMTQAHERWLQRANAQVRTELLVGVHEESGELQLSFANGESDHACALFLCAPLRQRYPLVAMLGCRIDDGGNIDIDERGRTQTQGVYAAGDCVTDAHQVALATASGVCAAMALNEDLLAQDVRRMSS